MYVCMFFKSIFLLRGVENEKRLLNRTTIAARMRLTLGAGDFWVLFPLQQQVSLLFASRARLLLDSLMLPVVDESSSLRLLPST